MKKLLVHVDGNGKAEDLLEIIWESYDDNITLMCSVASVTPYSLQPHGLQLTRPSMGVPKQEYWGGFPLPSPADPPNPGIELEFPVSPAMQVDSSPLSHQGSPVTLITLRNV